MYSRGNKISINLISSYVFVYASFEGINNMVAVICLTNSEMAGLLLLTQLMSDDKDEQRNIKFLKE